MGNRLSLFLGLFNKADVVSGLRANQSPTNVWQNLIYPDRYLASFVGQFVMFGLVVMWQLLSNIKNKLSILRCFFCAISRCSLLALISVQAFSPKANIILYQADVHLPCRRV
jgi:hypothetical protein